MSDLRCRLDATHLWRWGLVFLLWVLFAQAVMAASRLSITLDEGLHITSGYTILRTRDYRLIEEHPPLIKTLLALSVLTVPDLPEPTTLPGWESDLPSTDNRRLWQATEALVFSYRPIDRLVFPARVSVVLLTVVLGALVSRWAMDMWGWKGSVLALFLLAFDPNILAHASLATTDLGVTLFITLALFALQRFLRRPTLSRLILAGVSLGLSLSAKLSATSLLPVVVLLSVLPLSRRRKLHYLLLMLFIAGVTLWGTYAFEVRPIPGLAFPVPAASHLVPWLRLREHMALGHSAFLMGQTRQFGWWYYFPVAFGIKTPLPMLMLFPVAGMFLCRGIRRSTLEESTLLIFPLVYAGSALFSTLNMGYRHLLPILPLLFIWIARLAAPAQGFSFSCRVTQVLRLALLALLLWYALGTAVVFPDYLAYFNEIAGGPDGGYRWLVDSNLDWGQNYKELKTWLDARGIQQVYLGDYGFTRPDVYGIRADRLPAASTIRFTPFDPAPGWYVISATALQGVYMPDKDTFAYFRAIQPTARIGHALFVYHVLEEPRGEWLAQCARPAPPLALEDIKAGFGRGLPHTLHLVEFDCSTSRWYPAVQSPGWYVDVPGNFLQVAHWYPSARLVFQPRQAKASFASMYRVDQPSPPPGREIRAIAVLDEQVPLLGAQLTAPFSTTGPLEFNGFWPDSRQAVRPGQSVVLFTAWRVTRPADAPLSIMAHLIDAQGRVIAGADGLGVPTETWQVGDLIVQSHQLTVPPNTPPGRYQIQTGLYRLDNMERYRILSGDHSTSDRWLLAAIEVKP